MKIIILLLLYVVNIQNIFSQTNYYSNQTGIINKNDYTYKYKPCSLGLDIELYNSNAVYYGVAEKERLDGVKESYETSRDSKSGIDGANLTMDYINNLIKSKFSLEQKNIINEIDLGLGILLTINTTTGKVADVVMSMPQESKFMYIPVEVYRSIELDIKEKLIFDINERGREFNYGVVFWYINF